MTKIVDKNDSVGYNFGMKEEWNHNTGIRSIIMDTPQVDVHILGFAIERNAPDASPCDASIYDYFTIHYILDGHGWAIYDGVKREIQTDNVFVLFPGQKVTYSQDETDSWTVGWCTLNGMKVAQYLERARIEPTNPIVHVGHNKTLRRIFSETPYICEKSPEFSDVIALSAFYGIIAAISASADQGKRIRIRRTEQRHVSDAIVYINKNYSNPDLRLDTVANELGVTPKYLSAIFKRVTGQTFNKFVANKRISVANGMMEEGHTSVSDIAYACGFKSPYYFSNVYRKFNRDSPKTHIKRVAAPKKIVVEKKKRNHPTKKR